MKTSVLIIAHNEERYIERCLESIVSQTQKADEVILVVHNSTDRTEELAQKFPITIIPYTGPSGSVHARIEGLKHVSGDIILCTDGDTFVAHNWIEIMCKTLSRGNSLVGSWIKFIGNDFSSVSNLFNRYLCVLRRNQARWIWGASFGLWSKDKQFAIEMLDKTDKLSKEIGLTRNPDDYWLALFMAHRGTITVTNRTHVSAFTKEGSNQRAIKRHLQNMRNGDKMERYFINHEI